MNNKKENKVVLACLPELGKVLKAELESLDYKVISFGSKFVEIQATLEDTYFLNLHIQTASHIYYLIEEFGAINEKQLYTNLKKIAWETIIPDQGYFSIDSFVSNDTISDKRYANLRVKDAIADRLIDKTGKRADSGNEKNQTVIYLFWNGDTAKIYLDTSGETLAKRGYRKNPFKAPLNETLAAGILLSTQWDKAKPLVNPMCGSGTLSIEAARMALNIPAGFYRRNFGFMHYKGYDASVWKKMRADAEKKILTKTDVKIIATDKNRQAIGASRENAKYAGVEDCIEFSVCNYDKTPMPRKGGIVIFNPEYGERMGELEYLNEIYKGIGDFLKNQCQGYFGYIFTGNPELSKRVGLRTKSRQIFYNAKIECRLLEYEMFRGDWKGKFNTDGMKNED